MGKRTHYPPGTYAWVDLSTTDLRAAKAFYGGLFGWETEDGDAGSATSRLDGDAVAGMVERRNGPPVWTNYVGVVDAEAAAARATELGGAVVAGAAEVAGARRTAVLADPQGARFGVWEPGARLGAERVNDVGCLCMNELETTDLDGARAFYAGLFGWTTEVVAEGPNGPAMVFAMNDGRLNASLLPASDGAAPHWRPCFTVASTRASLARVRELGGRPLGEPVPVEEGSHATARDPQGALFTMYEGETDP